MSAARNSRRRRRNRGRFSALFKMLAIVAVLAALTVGATVFFQLEEVVVSGNSRYTAQEIEKISGLQKGDNLYRLNKNRIASEIREKLPYIEELTIVRRLPSTIVITVKEWDAVAKIVPTPLAGQSAVKEAPKPDGSAGQDETAKPDVSAPDKSVPDQSAAPDKESAASKATDQTWLISVRGKLLEQAPKDSTAIEVLGLSAIGPRAGGYLAVPQEQQGKLDALLALLGELEAQGSIGLVSQIDLTAAAQIRMRYDERFWVKLPMGGDFNYKLRALAKVAPDWKDYGGGTFDLTREDYPVTFSPE